jgi:hypothetical protein
MRIALINGSPKGKNSASECILKDLEGLLKNSNCIIDELKISKPQISKEEMEHLSECNVLVFAFPLYVDGIPSHLLSCLVDLEMHFAANENKGISVYALVNCGFYEAHQTKLAIEMMENWCAKAGLKWGQGLGIGAGGMLLSLKGVPIGYGPKKSFALPFQQLAGNIEACAAGESLFVTPNFPRILYKLAAEMGWRRSIKANGLKRRDLFLKK